MQLVAQRCIMHQSRMPPLLHFVIFDEMGILTNIKKKSEKRNFVPAALLDCTLQGQLPVKYTVVVHSGGD